MPAPIDLFESLRCPAEEAVRAVRDDSIASSGVPEAIAERAMQAARANIPWDDLRPQASRARTEAYYWAAVRGMVLRSRDPEAVPLKSRFALAAIVNDMRARGMSMRAVRTAVIESHSDLLAAAKISATQLDVAC